MADIEDERDGEPLSADGKGASSKASTLEDDDCFIKLKAWFKAAKEHSDDWRSDARDDYAFAAGDQWTDAERSVLKEQMRPIITFNRISPVLDSVAGIEISNRQEVRYMPRTEGDVQADEVLSAAADWFRDQCDAEDEESDAFMDVLTCGMGWTETRLDYEVDEEGAPVIDRTDPLEMYWDPGSRKRNLEDAKFIFRVRRIPCEEAEALIPGAEEEDIDASWALGSDASPDGETQEEARFYRRGKGGDQGEDDNDREMVTVVECQWFERESVHVFADPMTGELAELPEDDFKVFAKRAPDLGINQVQSVTMSRRKYYRAYLGKRLLLKEVSPFPGHFSYKAITGKRDRNKGTYFGLVRQMKDPQRWANKWLSQTLHIMNTNAKGGIIAESGIADDMREFERTYARPDAVTWVKNGAMAANKFAPKPASQLPAGYFNLMEFAISSVRDATGVNLELLGMADRQQAGVLEAQRKRSAMAILATLFDSLRRYRKAQGRLLMQIIVEHLSDNRLVRIVGEEGQKYVPLIRDPNVTKYDVIVDDAPSSPHQREQTWQVLTQMLPVVAENMTPDMWAAILPYAPLPSSVAEKLKGIIAENGQQEAQAGAKQAQLGEAKATADIDEVRSKAELNRAKAISEVMPDAPPSGSEQARPAPPPAPQPGGGDAIAMLVPYLALIADGQQQMGQQIAGAMQGVSEQMNAPREIVRDEMGNAVGVSVGGNVREIVRDEDQNILGLR